MSDKLDPQLRFIQEAKKKQLEELAETRRFGLDTEAAQPRANVLLRFEAADVSALEAAGLEIGTVAGDVVTGSIDVAKLGALADADGVLAVEGSRPMARELDLAVVESRANLVHTGPPGHRGAGVIVGIVDSGIDWRHECFRRADGSSRILFIWDQFLAPAGRRGQPGGLHLRRRVLRGADQRGAGRHRHGPPSGRRHAVRPRHARGGHRGRRRVGGGRPRQPARGHIRGRRAGGRHHHGGQPGRQLRGWATRRARSTRSPTSSSGPPR